MKPCEYCGKPNASCGGNTPCNDCFRPCLGCGDPLPVSGPDYHSDCAPTVPLFTIDYVNRKVNKING